MWLEFKRICYPTVERLCRLNRLLEVRYNTSSPAQSQFEPLRHALCLIRSAERTKVHGCLSPLLAGGCVNVHALGAGQGLGLCLQTVRWRAGERADTLAALAAVSNPYG